MFGCLGRLGCLVLLAIICVGGWFTKDLWYPRVRALVVSEPPARGMTWMPVTSDAADRATVKIAKLSEKNGPVFTDLTPSEFAARVMMPAMKMLGSSAGDPEAAIHGDTLFVRANVALNELGDLGPMSSMLNGRQPVVIGGRLDVAGKGVAQFHVVHFTVKELKIPAAAVAKIVARVGMKARTDVIDASAVALPLASTVADVRVAKGRVVLYKAVP
jgi:hypothetical protein